MKSYLCNFVFGLLADYHGADCAPRLTAYAEAKALRRQREILQMQVRLPEVCMAERSSAGAYLVIASRSRCILGFPQHVRCFSIAYIIVGLVWCAIDETYLEHISEAQPGNAYQWL